ncbi:site-specific DNA-methyltransferase [Trueperella abortisuis]|uniref:site-specific DNA-methyltransferase n=1 Tax=Trueperella abortisuis TaxID=445930 RepID=UPI002893143A|nr:site-specific DNA-methyltransferase [Trueperella abortisuis]
MGDTTHEVPGTTPDFATEAAERLAELFPEVIADGKINVERLKALLGEDVEDGRERFGLTWPGKRDAIRAAQTPTTATLMPDKENSIDWDITENVFIEGDNLEVLKILQKHYYGQIKMIYIDPPYNTGNDFVYSDNYADSIGSYLELTGQTDEGGKLSTNSESAGRFHSNWLNMMYPRLKLARNLLREDGAVFISIDEVEIGNLKQICNEVFGENNLIGSMIWAAGRKNDSKFISASHEYILCYVRNKSVLTENGITWKVRKKGLEAIYAAAEQFVRESGGNYNAASAALKAWYKSLADGDDSKKHKHYSRIDERGVYFPGDISWPGGGGPKYEVLHPVTGQPVKVPSRGWLFQKDVMDQHIRDTRVLFGATEDAVPTFKRYLKDTELEVPYSVFYQDGRAATKRLTNLMGSKVFDFPKDEYVLQTLLAMTTDDRDIILDFFAGSGTTAHAVMQLNAEDGGNRRCISVQLPEPTGEKSEARKAGYRTISEITRERIRRAGKKILEEETSKLDGRADSLDVGFRAYKLVDTNFTKWKADSGLSEDELVGLFSDLADSADDHARPEALLTEALLKLGFSLTEKIETVTVAGLSVFSVADGLVMAYLDEHTQPTLDQLRALVAREPERLVVLEDAFQGNDELKTNLVQECRTRNVDLWTA